MAPTLNDLTSGVARPLNERFATDERTASVPATRIERSH